MCVGHPAEKLDQIDVVKGFLRPTDGIDRAACTRSQNGPVSAMREYDQRANRCRHTPPQKQVLYR